jgi:hypothetical protein
MIKFSEKQKEKCSTNEKEKDSHKNQEDFDV